MQQLKSPKKKKQTSSMPNSAYYGAFIIGLINALQF